MPPGGPRTYSRNSVWRRSSKQRSQHQRRAKALRTAQGRPCPPVWCPSDLRMPTGAVAPQVVLGFQLFEAAREFRECPAVTRDRPWPLGASACPWFRKGSLHGATHGIKPHSRTPPKSHRRCSSQSYRGVRRPSGRSARAGGPVGARASPPSSAPIRREYPATSAARIAVRRRTEDISPRRSISLTKPTSKPAPPLELRL